MNLEKKDMFGLRTLVEYLKGECKYHKYRQELLDTSVEEINANIEPLDLKLNSNSFSELRELIDNIEKELDDLYVEVKVGEYTYYTYLNKEVLSEKRFRDIIELLSSHRKAGMIEGDLRKPIYYQEGFFYLRDDLEIKIDDINYNIILETSLYKSGINVLMNNSYLAYYKRSTPMSEYYMQ